MKRSNNGKKRSGNRWTPEEDQILRSAVEEYGLAQHRESVGMDVVIDMKDFIANVLPGVIRSGITTKKWKGWNSTQRHEMECHCQGSTWTYR